MDQIVNVRTRFDLNPEQEQTQVQKAQTINLQRVGEKASLNTKKRYRLLVFKGKSYTCRNAKKHPRLYLSSVINSLEFFLFYCCVSSTFLSPFCFFTSFYLNSFSCYIPWFLPNFLYPRVSQVLGVFLFSLAYP